GSARSGSARLIDSEWHGLVWRVSEVCLTGLAWSGKVCLGGSVWRGMGRHGLSRRTGLERPGWACLNGRNGVVWLGVARFTGLVWLGMVRIDPERLVSLDRGLGLGRLGSARLIGLA
ncbi:MAG: hypothetical protein QMD10_13080, partial [Desulfitobacteriaceae bacterium]|nr:hypothetical protein [Desulfitobacteriaceae bacterium]